MSTVELPLTTTSLQRSLFFSLWTNNRHCPLFKPLYNGPYFCPKGGRLERFNCSRISQNTSDIISYFHEYTIWIPINITGDKLLLQSYIFLFYFIENSETSEHAECYNFLGFGKNVWRNNLRKREFTLVQATNR